MATGIDVGGEAGVSVAGGRAEGGVAIAERARVAVGLAVGSAIEGVIVVATVNVPSGALPPHDSVRQTAKIAKTSRTNPKVWHRPEINSNPPHPLERPLKRWCEGVMRHTIAWFATSSVARETDRTYISACCKRRGTKISGVSKMEGYPRDEWTRYGGLRMHVRDWGGEGPPVVLLHGLASTCRIWDFVAPILAKDFSVIAVDQRGHGDSGKPEQGYDFASVAEDAAALAAGRNIQRPVVVGHSWGADVALELAVARPELLWGIIFVDGGTIDASARYDTLDDALVQMAPPDFTGVMPDQFLERVRSGGQWATLIEHHGIPAEEIILANFETLDDGTLRAKLSRDNHLRIIRALWDHHPRELYPQVQCPVLMMPARQRDNPDAYERTLARSESIAAAERLLPRSKTVWLEDSIHDVPVQRPELVAATIREHILAGFFD